MKLANVNIGIGITGSFCTFDKILKSIEEIKETGATITTILSEFVQNTDTRFGSSKDFLEKIKTITGTEPICTITDAEPLGPKNKLDVLLLAPCTGSTLGKLANAITDTPVLMAAKGHLRNNKPLVLSISTNDALSANFKNIGLLFNMKNFYFVPFGQDNYEKKPNSMIAHTELIVPTLESALDGKQLQPAVF